MLSSVDPKEGTESSATVIVYFPHRALCFYAIVCSETCSLLYLFMGICAFSLKETSSVQSLTYSYSPFSLQEAKTLFCLWMTYCLPFAPPTHSLSVECRRSFLKYSSHICCTYDMPQSPFQFSTLQKL